MNVSRWAGGLFLIWVDNAYVMAVYLQSLLILVAKE